MEGNFPGGLFMGGRGREKKKYIFVFCSDLCCSKDLSTCGIGQLAKSHNLLECV